MLYSDFFGVETGPDRVVTFRHATTVIHLIAGPNIAGTGRPQTEFGTFFNPATAREELIGRTRGRFTSNGADLGVRFFGDDIDISKRFSNLWQIQAPRRSSNPRARDQYAARGQPELAQLVPPPVVRLAGRWHLDVWIDWHRYDGEQDVAVAPGTFNVAHTFIAPNPATGTTGILLGATGDQISVRSHGGQVNPVVNLIFTQPMPGPFGAGEIWYWSLGAGARLGIRWDSHEIMQQSMTFSGIAMTTDLSTSEVFAGPNLTAGAGIDRGDIFGAINAYVAPGALFISGKAKQTSLCNLCPLAGDRNIAQELNFDTTKFAVKVGVEVKGGYRFTRNFAIEGSFGFHHTSHTGAIHNPITPIQQPAALFTGTTNTIVGSIRAVLRW